MNLACVREILRAILITPLPEAPLVIEGVIDVRGDLVPVYDLRLRFGLPPRALHPDDRFIVAWTGDRLAALRCERTGWIEAVPADAIDRPEFASGERIAGVARLPDGVVLIHDLATFLEEAEAQDLARALETRREAK